MVAEVAVVRRELERRGVGRGDLVAVCLPPSARLLAAQVAITSAAAAFVPIDPHAPAGRRARMLAASDCRLVLTDSTAWTPELDGGRLEPVHLDRLAPDDGGSAPVCTADPEDLCYVMFTSGSTGEPKGIQLRHRGVLNNIADLADRYALGDGDSVLALSSPCLLYTSPSPRD